MSHPNQKNNPEDYIAISSHINEEGHKELIIDGEAFVQVCTTCGTPIPFGLSDGLDEFGNCVNCQGDIYA